MRGMSNNRAHRMVRAVLAASFALAASLSAFAQKDAGTPNKPAQAEPGAAPVAEISAGGRIEVTLDGTALRVELQGVQIPAAGKAQEDAKRFLDNLLSGETVYIEFEGGRAMRRADGRVLAYLFRAPDRLFVNAEIVRQGYARVDDSEECQHLDALRGYEQIAKRGAKGIWRAGKGGAAAARDPGPAPATRPAKPDATAAPSTGAPGAGAADDGTVYVTRSGTKYHRANCRHARDAQPLALEQARKKYEPCRVCKPPS